MEAKPAFARIAAAGAGQQWMAPVVPVPCGRDAWERGHAPVALVIQQFSFDRLSSSLQMSAQVVSAPLLVFVPHPGSFRCRAPVQRTGRDQTIRPQSTGYSRSKGVWLSRDISFLMCGSKNNGGGDHPNSHHQNHPCNTPDLHCLHHLDAAPLCTTVLPP